MSDETSERLKAIETQAREAKRLREDWEAAKAETSAAKSAWELAAENLERLILEAGTPLPLLDGAKPEDWQAVRLDSLSRPAIPSGAIAALKRAKVTTLGDLAAWTASGKVLADINGISAGRAEAVQAAVDAYWAGHPQPAKPA
jgi:hypothetical protein